MQPYQIILTVIYAALLISYFFVETGKNRKARIIIKCLLSTLFFVFGYINSVIGIEASRIVSRTHAPVFVYVIICCALLLNMIGDIILVVGKTKKSFVGGAAVFFAGGLVLAAAMISLMAVYSTPFSNVWWGLLLFPVVYGIFLVIQLKKKFNFRSLAVVGNIYIGSITAMGSIGLMTIAAGIAGSFITSAIGIGALLFMASDYFLIYYNFKYHKPAILVTNSALYFIGMWFIALSLGGVL